MNQNLKRLSIAAAFSSSVFAANYIWYMSSQDSNSRSTNEKPLAYVGPVIDDIQRRPAARLLWQTVNQGEPLFNGEAIRTSQKGEVRIQFAESDRYLDLEPESLIVIKQSSGEIALDLMEGSLFVNASAPSGAANNEPGIVLNSASGKVDLSRASAALTKTKGQDLKLQVIEGKANIQGKDGKTQELSTGSTGSLSASGEKFDISTVKIISPLANRIYYKNPDSPEPLYFKWTGFPQGSEVNLWVGNQRKNLKQLKSSTTEEMEAPLPFGKSYWKLVATRDGQVVAETSVFRSEVLPRPLPTVVSPITDAEYETIDEVYPVTFKWQKGETVQSINFQVWKETAEGQPLFEQRFTAEDTFTLPSLKQGRYFWRLQAFYLESTQPTEGKIQKFTIKKPIDVNVDLAWLNFAPEETQNFVTEPEVSLTWKAAESQYLDNYRVTITPEDSNSQEETQSLLVKNAAAKTKVSAPGRYIASIEALDKNGQVIGTAPQKILNVQPLPKISAPQFLGEGNILQAQRDGKLELVWSASEGAKEYEVVISKNGKELKRTKYRKTSTNIQNLMPGDYEASVIAIDQYGRESEGSPAKVIKVPDNSGLKAPSLKKIKVN